MPSMCVFETHFCWLWLACLSACLPACRLAAEQADVLSELGLTEPADKLQVGLAASCASCPASMPMQSAQTHSHSSPLTLH